MTDTSPTFAELGVPEVLAQTVGALGYTEPTPIQQAALPVLLDGRDLVGHAPTGTGKTAAFGLSLLARVDPDTRGVQAIILTPTRELAIQVAEALSGFASEVPRVHVLAVYGGQEYGKQIRALQRGAQVVVGTPGRVMDHLKRGNLKLDTLRTLVLDEADEMLRMGFIDDVEWILDQTPDSRQTALFSATMPSVIRRIARKHLNNPEEINIQREAERAKDIRQRFWQVSGMSKLEALSRILEAEDKRGTINILVATDVVARGLDVERITHVVNYDVPFDAEAYVHRIGRTGRAGRRGEAILFVAPRERRLVSMIERVTKSRIEPMQLPDVDTINKRRVERFLKAIDATIESANLGRLETVLEQHAEASDVPMARIAAALAQQTLGEQPLFLKPDSRGKKPKKPQRRDDAFTPATRERNDKPAFAQKARPEKAARAERPSDAERTSRPDTAQRKERKPRPTAQPNERFRVEIGSQHGVKATHIVGAIANEADMDAAFIGKIQIHDDHSTVELPIGMPKPILRDLRKAWVLGRRLDMSRDGAVASDTGGSRPPKKQKAGGGKSRRPEKAAR